MSTICNFEFDRPEPIYYSGETIRGRIVLITKKTKYVRAVHITFDGEAKVRWTETERHNSRKNSHVNSVNFTGHQQYLHSRTIVVGEGEIPIGTHTYTFQIDIPSGCPTTCIGIYGHIMYKIVLTLDRPLLFDNVFTKPITIVNKLDLSLNPERYMIPVKAEEIKSYCCWPCASGPIQIEVTIPFDGYTPGQNIRVQFIIDNMASDFDIKRSFVSLRQQFTFKSQMPEAKIRKNDKKLAGVKFGGALRLTKKMYEANLIVPTIPPTSTDLSCIVQIQYFVVGEIEVGRYRKNGEISVPITIGTIPLSSFIEVRPENNIDTINDLPTYEDADFQDLFIDGDIKDFVPKYPVYKKVISPSAPKLDENTEDDVEKPQS